MRRVAFGLAALVLLTGCGVETKTSPPVPATTASAPTGGPAAAPQDAGAVPPTVKPQASPDAGTPAPSAEGAPDPTGTPLQQAIQLAQSGKMEGAIQVLKKAVADDATNRQLRVTLIQIVQGHGIQTLQEKGEKEAGTVFLEAATLARQLAQDFQPLTDDEKSVVGVCLYNGACFESKLGKLDEAQKSLEEAFAAGFADLAQLDKDEDLAPLRERPEYQAFRDGIEKKLAEAAQREALENLAKFESFPFDFALTDLEGKERKLADYKGKVLIVDIWGTWCPPCRMEIPHFIELHKKHKEQGLEIVGINYEEGSPEEIKDVIKKFIEENGMTYTCVIGDDATRDRVPNFEGFPTTLFIDRTGKVRFKEVGYRPLAALEAVVSTLLAEPAPEPAAETN